ncbi:zinc finger MYM-type protein 1-like [Calliopsis andreniformis]|uniref:zinc finger MYM-type protein 1-like n=1 Tax=Calliopsis andreniformis TaxID=337506 RepID=UPI003FCCCF6F
MTNSLIDLITNDYLLICALLYYILLVTVIAIYYCYYKMKKFKDTKSYFKTMGSRSEETTNDAEAINRRKTRINTRPDFDTPLTVSAVHVICSDEKFETELRINKEQEYVNPLPNLVYHQHQQLARNLGTLETDPIQPRINFPKSKLGDRQRSFSSKYYDTYSWLEYSVKEDKVYSFVCRHFLKVTIRDQIEKFISSGFNNWKKLKEALQKHDQSSLHIQSTQMFICYKQSVASGSIHEKLVMQHTEEVGQNRDYLVKLTDIILCLVRQGLPLRGHCEDPTSKNRDNFLEISELFAKYNEHFSKHLEQHTNYYSPKIQNEIIDIIAQLILQEIIKEVKGCEFFSLIHLFFVDEARCYKEEQLSVTIRYVKNLDVEKRFIGFINCSTSRDATGLAEIICTDRRIAPSSNLYSLKVSSATAFFNTLEALYIHFSQPGNHARLLKVHASLGIKSGRQMGSWSNTRYSCRYENCKAAQNKNSVEALGILTYITKPDFFICLFVFQSVLSIMNVLSKYFQSKSATLGQATDIITGIITSFEEKEHEISLEPTLVSRRRRNPEGINDFVIESTLGKVDAFIKLVLEHGELFVANYKPILNIDIPTLQAEIVIVKNMLKKKNFEINLETLKNEINKDYCPNLYKLLQVAISLPVSSAGCERSFSTMRRIKNWLRTIMLQERSSNMVLLNIENEIDKTKITAQQVLNIFSKKKLH